MQTMSRIGLMVATVFQLYDGHASVPGAWCLQPYAASTHARRKIPEQKVLVKSSKEAKRRTVLRRHHDTMSHPDLPGRSKSPVTAEPGDSVHTLSSELRHGMLCEGKATRANIRGMKVKWVRPKILPEVLRRVNLAPRS